MSNSNQHEHPLKSERKRLHLSRKALADFAVISESTIVRAERGDQIGAYAKKQLCGYLGKSANELGLIPQATAYLLKSTEIDPGYKQNINRREALQVLGGASMALMNQPHSWIMEQPWELLSRALTRPSYLDNNALNVLDSFNSNYWQLRSSVPVRTLLPGMIGHLQSLTQMLNSSLTPSTRNRLCIIAGRLAMSLGAMNLDIKEPDAALGYYQSALIAAKESEDISFKHVALGRLGFCYMNIKQPYNTALLLEEASNIPVDLIDSSFHIWLTLVEAEARSLMGDSQNCRNLLDKAKTLFSRRETSVSTYLIDLDDSTIDAYEGACYVHLKQGDKAILALRAAESKLPKTLQPRKALILADLAAAFALQGELEESSHFMLEVNSIVLQTQSVMAMEKAKKARSYLEPWKNSQVVRSLDEQLPIGWRV